MTEDAEPREDGWHCDWCAEVYPKAEEAINRLVDSATFYGTTAPEASRRLAGYNRRDEAQVDELRHRLSPWADPL